MTHSLKPNQHIMKKIDKPQIKDAAATAGGAAVGAVAGAAAGTAYNRAAAQTQQEAAQTAADDQSEVEVIAHTEPEHPVSQSDQPSQHVDSQVEPVAYEPAPQPHHQPQPAHQPQHQAHHHQVPDPVATVAEPLPDEPQVVHVVQQTQPGQPEVIAYERITDDDGSQMDVAVISDGTNQIGVIDLDLDGKADMIVCDLNHNEVIEEDEIQVVQGQGIDMQPLQEAAGFSPLYAQNDLPDYVNDADIGTYTV